MNYLVLDIETTGDDPGWHDLVRLSSILCKEDWQEISRFETLIYPKAEDSFSLIPDRNPTIDIKELEAAPVMFDAIDQWEEWIIKANGLRPDPMIKEEALTEVVLGGHQFVNTYSFLRMAYGDENKNWFYSDMMLDLSTLGHALVPLFEKSGLQSPKSWSLGALCRTLGIEMGEEEDSETMRQVEMIRRCFVACRDLVRQ